jgi:hypothetical protein
MKTRWLVVLFAGFLSNLALAEEKLPPPDPTPPLQPAEQILPAPIVTACPEAMPAICGRGPAPMPPAPCITKRTIVEDQSVITLPVQTVRAVPVGRETQVDMVVDYRDEKRTVTVMELQPRKVERQITVYTPEAVNKVDPCTGHCTTEYIQVPSVKTIILEEFCTVPVEKTVIVRVPVVKAVNTEIEVRRLVRV